MFNVMGVLIVIVTVQYDWWTDDHVVVHENWIAFDCSLINVISKYIIEKNKFFLIIFNRKNIKGIVFSDSWIFFNKLKCCFCKHKYKDK